MELNQLLINMSNNYLNSQLTMTEDTHLNATHAMSMLSEGDSSHQGLHEIQDEQYSFNLTKLRDQNWQNMHDYEDSNMVQESSEPKKDILLQFQSFLEETKKALGEYQELKSAQAEFANRNDSSSSAQFNPEFHVQEERSRKKNMIRKTKIIEKQKRPAKPSKPVKKPSNMKNLKVISSEVCDFIESAQSTSYHTLFEHFVGNNSDENKNLRRRMYDVINVLSSAKVIAKKDEVLLRCRNHKKNKSHRKIKREATGKGQDRIQQISRLQKEKLERIAQKKKIVENLKQQKKNLQKLHRRNQFWGNLIPESSRLHFPLFFCQNSKELQMQISQQNQTVTLRKPAMAHLPKKEAKFIQKQIEVLKFLNLRRSKRIPKPVEINQTNYEEF